MKINENFQNLKDSYLFSTIAKKTKGQDVIRLGIGDVTLPLAPSVITALNKAVLEMKDQATFKGYGEEQGYLFLRQAILDYYLEKEVTLTVDEIFVSDGAKSDLGNILDLFSADNTVLIPDPVYPVYVDTNLMAGRKIVYLDGNIDNNFLPLPDDGIKADIIYLCSPNNPTGAVYDKSGLKTWVDYALANDAVILFDSAYEIFVRDEELPTSIYQIDGAKKCAIEFCSLSKTAGFTGTRCGYTVVPRELNRGGFILNDLWLRRQTTKFNGVPYIVQRGAEAVFTSDGLKEIKANINRYRDNAETITKTLSQLGIWYTGGTNAPYIWLKCPGQMTSWEFFDYLLEKEGIVGTPGSGFGANGEGFFRLSAFGNKEDTIKAMEKFKKIF
ncbi:MAG: LL-diaminopimelate aminotransferase [Lachnospiraceae bacterium]|nr:LL-diaminopimelate aminotransferase [Lachnospiraceae bacterium]